MPDAIDMAVSGEPSGNNGIVFAKETSQIPRMPDGSLAAELTPQMTTISHEPAKPQQSPLTSTEPLPSEELERARRNMQADYTRKTQELAEQRRQIEAERAQWQAIIQQQQQLASLQTPATAQQQSRQGVIRDLLGPQWETMDAQARQVWGTIDKATEVIEQRLDAKLAQLQQAQINPQVLGQIASEVIDVKTDQGIAGLRSLYGAETVNAYADQIKMACKQYPGLTADQALNSIAPHVQQNYAFEQGKKVAMEELKRQQQTSVSDGRSFMNAPVNAQYRIGESMRESARRQGAVFGDE